MGQRSTLACDPWDLNLAGSWGQLTLK